MKSEFADIEKKWNGKYNFEIEL